MELGDDEELDPTEEELEAETQEEPVMMRDAAYWDDFLELIDIIQEPWASPDGDTDAYRRGRALRAFNAGTLIYLGIATPYLIFCHSLSLSYLHPITQVQRYARTSATSLALTDLGSSTSSCSSCLAR